MSEAPTRTPGRDDREQKGGRPPLPPEQRRARRLTLRLREEELAELRERAREFDLSVSAYARRLVMRRKLRPGRLRPEELALLGQVNRMGNNLNQLMIQIYTHQAPLGLASTVRECLELLKEIRDLLATREGRREAAR